MPAGLWPVLSSTISVPLPASAVGSKIAMGPSFPISAVDQPLAEAVPMMDGSCR
jgi:hypothetical protein